MFTERDYFWMRRALELARASEAAGEVPVGAVLTLDDKMIGEGRNSPIHSVDPTAHAEIVALRHAALHMNNYRLPNTTLYVTLEPCVMCFGAIVHARVERVIFGATDPKAGAVCSAFQLETAKSFNHHPVCHAGLLQDACGHILTNFFQNKRAHSRVKVVANGGAEI